MKKIFKKKGFTLVELIVVIAIVGVLAAILIPTMLSYVMRSHVSNANTVAGKMRDNITYFLTEADAEGYGMFLSHTAVCDAEISITNGKWELITRQPECFVQHYTTKWVGNGSGWVGDTNSSSAIAESRLASYLANTFKELKEGYVKFRLIGGVCSVLYFTEDQTTEVTELPDFGTSMGWDVDTYSWDNRNQGVTPGGLVVGTSPLLPAGV
ncbi:MAG: DUF5021 domain-containing protein [Ruminiclostridium sp.]|nr:DUF5021 domain-containing protein [Ruminiclostridium sp.]